MCDRGTIWILDMAAWCSGGEIEIRFRYVVMGEAVFYRVFVCFTECIMRKGWVGLEGGHRAVGRGEEHEEGVQE